ncbi:MAG: hypothetical protein J0M07_22860 [Anaerolineae bacterium]|nr:hypothetical protein [Anaerolineae bacterium]
MAQQHFDHDRMVMVTGKAIKLPEHNRVKLALFRRFLQLDKAFTVKAPTRSSRVGIDGDNHPAAIRNRLAASPLLPFKAEIGLHFR